MKTFCISETRAAFERNDNFLTDYERELRIMEESMMEYHEYILKKTDFYAVCQSGRRWLLFPPKNTTPPRVTGAAECNAKMAFFNRQPEQMQNLKCNQNNSILFSTAY